MQMNWAERALVQIPGREWLLRNYEAKRLLELGGRMNGGRALEIGCGNGSGTRVILDLFQADRVDAIDLDPRLVRAAIQRTRQQRDRISVTRGDATAIDVDDGNYDAVFNFAIIHHIPDWRSAVAEVYRVLRPGGRFYAHDVFAKFIHDPLMKRLFEHPMEDRFDHDQFAAALLEAGFTLVDSSQLWERFGWFIADRPAR
jgi:ubiquinone/menaquinone biosynthesis C-methylase UbiE